MSCFNLQWETQYFIMPPFPACGDQGLLGAGWWEKIYGPVPWHHQNGPNRSPWGICSAHWHSQRTSHGHSGEHVIQDERKLGCNSSFPGKKPTVYDSSWIVSQRLLLGHILGGSSCWGSTSWGMLNRSSPENLQVATPFEEHRIGIQGRCNPVSACKYSSLRYTVQGQELVSQSPGWTIF